jgi:hypothetical protein
MKKYIFLILNNTTMKNLLIAILLLISVAASAQLTVDSNPGIINPTNTSVVSVTFTNRPAFREVVVITIPAANAGTVTINTISSTLTNSVTYAAGVEHKIILTVRERFYIQFSNAADFAYINW